MVGDAEHRQIPKRIEVIFGESALSDRLGEWDQCPLVAEIADKAAEVGIGVINPADILDNATIIEPKAGHVLDKFNLREPVDEVVISLANQKEEG